MFDKTYLTSALIAIHARAGKLPEVDIKAPKACQEIKFGKQRKSKGERKRNRWRLK